MNSLFFIDPNNENANLCACAVRERRAQAPGTAIARARPCACFCLLFTGKTGHSRLEPKGFWRNEPNCKTLVERRPRAAQAFDARAALFRFEPALAGAGGRLGRPAWNRRHGGAADQINETLARVLAVAFLGAMALGVDHDHAVAREASAGEPLEPRAHVVGKVRRAAHVEAKLHRARELVDVLPAGPRRADEMLLELALADADRRSYADHRRLIAPMIPFSRCISTTSPPGLTRGSIISSQEVLPRRWIAGSSPAMTSHE